MAMKFHGNVRGEVRVNFLALFASKPHIFMCGALKLSGIVRANVRLNIAIPMLFWFLICESLCAFFARLQQQPKQKAFGRDVLRISGWTSRAPKTSPNHSERRKIEFFLCSDVHDPKVWGFMTRGALRYNLCKKTSV